LPFYQSFHKLIFFVSKFQFMKTCAIYARVSTSAQTEGASLESQVEACRVEAQARGLTVLREFKEVFSGASLLDRPLLAECREEVRGNRLDAVIVFDIDRLSRNIIHLGIFLEECDRFNTALVFVNSDFERSPEGMLLFSIRGYLAEAERLKITERTTRGRRHKAKDGTLSFKRKLYGYTLNAEGKREIYAPEAEVVKEMFRRLAAGDSLWSIAGDFNKRNVPKPSGRGAWWANNIKCIVTNPAYTGRTVVFRQKKISRYDAGKKILTTRHTEADTQTELPAGTTPAIVSQAEFDAVKRTLDFNRQNRRRVPQKEALLRGLLFCQCGRMMSYRVFNRWPAYACTSKQNPAVNCRTRALNAKEGESAVWELAEKFIKHPERLKKLILKTSGQIRQAEKANKDLQSVNSQIARTEREIQNLAARAATVTDAVWTIIKEQLELKQKELQILQAMRLEAEARLQNAEAEEIDADELARRLNLIDLSNLDFAARVAALNLLRATIEWNGIELKVNFGGITI
jgi:site-specific DNA recombinase